MPVRINENSPEKPCRILIVEDTLIVAEMMAMILRDSGCAVVGPFATLDEGLQAALDEESLSGALLDVNLNGTNVFPLAEALRKKGAPMIFLTGYDPSILPAVFKDCPVLEKPFSAGELKAVVQSTFAVQLK